MLVDASYLYAIYNARDKHYAEAVAFANQTESAPLIPEIVLPEVAYLFERDLGHYAVAKFLDEFASTEIKFVSLSVVDIRRVHEIMTTYASAEFDIVDTCIMALSERLQITQVCTFDRRDFSIFRPMHCDYLELLP